MAFSLSCGKFIFFLKNYSNDFQKRCHWKDLPLPCVPAYSPILLLLYPLFTAFEKSVCECLTHIFLFFFVFSKTTLINLVCGINRERAVGSSPVLATTQIFLHKKYQKYQIFGFFDRFNLKTVKKRSLNFFGTKNVALGKDIVLFGFFAFIDSL